MFNFYFQVVGARSFQATAVANSDQLFVVSVFFLFEIYFNRIAYRLPYILKISCLHDNCSKMLYFYILFIFDCYYVCVNQAFPTQKHKIN